MRDTFNSDWELAQSFPEEMLLGLALKTKQESIDKDVGKGNSRLRNQYEQMGKTVQQKSEGPEGKVVGDEGEMKDYEGFMCRGIRISHKK